MRFQSSSVIYCFNFFLSLSIFQSGESPFSLYLSPQCSIFNPFCPYLFLLLPISSPILSHTLLPHSVSFTLFLPLSRLLLIPNPLLYFSLLSLFYASHQGGRRREEDDDEEEVRKSKFLNRRRTTDILAFQHPI